MSISAEKHFFSFFSTVGASAISFLNKLEISLCTAFSIRTDDCPMAMFLFFACSAIVICSGILVDFKIFSSLLEWHLEVIYKTNNQLYAFVRDRYKVQKLVRC